MGWDSELKFIITKTWAIGERFSLEEVYALEGHFTELYPSNSHVKDKLRQTLQHLRDAGIVEFIDDSGSYVRIK